MNSFRRAQPATRRLPRLTGYPVSARNDNKETLKCRQIQITKRKLSNAGHALSNTRQYPVSDIPYQVSLRPCKGQIIIATGKEVRRNPW